MKNRFSTACRLQLLRLGACGMLAAGIALPQIRTISGYTYDMVGTAATIGFALAAALAALALFDEHLSRPIAEKLHGIGLAALVGMAVWGAYIAHQGINWFDYQIAADMSTWPAVDADAYWAKLYQLMGVASGESIFNDLRTAHARFGPGVEVNDVPVFYNAINALTLEQIKELRTVKGGGYLAVPWGCLLIAGAAVAYGWLLLPWSKLRIDCVRLSTQR